MPRPLRVFVEGGFYHVYNRLAWGEGEVDANEEATEFVRIPRGVVGRDVETFLGRKEINSMAGFVRFAFLVILLGAACGVSENANEIANCPEIDVEASLGEVINPVCLLEDGVFLSENGEPVSRECAGQRICQVDEYTRVNFGQSYRISLFEPGGIEIERQFPEIVASIVESRGNTRRIYLHTFCEELKIARADLRTNPGAANVKDGPGGSRE